MNEGTGFWPQFHKHGIQDELGVSEQKYAILEAVHKTVSSILNKGHGFCLKGHQVFTLFTICSKSAELHAAYGDPCLTHPSYLVGALTHPAKYIIISSRFHAGKNSSALLRWRIERLAGQRSEKELNGVFASVCGTAAFGPGSRSCLWSSHDVGYLKAFGDVWAKYSHYSNRRVVFFMPFVVTAVI